MYILDRINASNLNEENLAFLAAIGVDYVGVDVPPELFDDGAAAAEVLEKAEEFFARAKGMVEQHGMVLYNSVHLPTLASALPPYPPTTHPRHRSQRR